MSSVAFLFPGQGSQTCGMLSSYRDIPLCHALFDEASAYYEEDLWSICQEGPAEKLNNTYYTQIIMLIADVLIAFLWADHGGEAPAMMAGHSLGEYAALVCAGVLSFSDTVRVVHQRASLMASVSGVELGMMAAIGGDIVAVSELCRTLSSENACIEVANTNTPTQHVLSGDLALLKTFQEKAKSCGVKRCIHLPVSSAFHSSYMTDAAMSMGRFLSSEDLNFTPPCIPIIHNYGLCQYKEAAALFSALAAQINHPVPWVETLHQMYDFGIDRFIEMGPGSVLSGLVKKTLPQSCQTIHFRDYEDLCQQVTH